MKTRGWRTLGLLVALLAFCAWSGLGLAFAPKPAATSLDQKEFFKPELHISMDNVKLEEFGDSLANKTAWNRFFTDYGRDFQVYLDPRSGTTTSILGHVPLIPGRGVDNHLTLADMGATLARPVTEIDSELVAGAVRGFIVRNADVMAVDTTQLGAIRADKITNELWQVNIRQMVDGIPVRWGHLAATINNGNLVLIGTEAWGNVRISTKPLISSDDAQRIGYNYAGGEQLGDKMWMKPQLEIVPFAPADLQNGEAYAGPVGQGYGHRLVWTFGFIRQGDPAAWQASVDARTGEVIEFKDTNDYVTKKISGGIYPVTDTGVCPDNARCGTMQPNSSMPWANTGFAAPDDFTNSAGLYNYTSGTLTTTFNGKYVKLIDTCGAISATSATGDLDLGGVNGDHDCTVPAGSSAGNTAATRSAFYEVNKLAELARGWLPSNVWLPAQLQTTVNIGSTCNAYYSSNTINFYKSGGGCRNTGEIAAVFDHEWGHGLDYHDTNGTASVTSESYADIAAIYRLQQSCVGYGFWWTSDQGCGMTSDGTGFNGDNGQTSPACELDCSGVRGVDYAKHTGGVPDTPANFSCTKCQTGSGPCGREVHCDAMPASEAAWDLAARDLQAAPFNYDSNTAFALANKLFYQGSGNVGSWHTCTCPSTSGGCGATNAYMQWLAADDDNGNVSDGTPHMTALYAAWNRHAIACATPTPVNSGCAGGPTTAPTLTAAPGSNQVVLSWTPVAGAVNYWVFRGEGFAGCDFGKALIAKVPGTTYTDNQVANGREYYYNVVAAGSSEACFTPMSSCIRATPQPCAGAVSLDRGLYNCNDSMAISLVDSDLIGAGTQVVTVRSTTEATPENVLLTETPAASGIFTGTFLTTGSGAVNGDGKISVQNGDTITVKYTDVSYCGTPNVDVEQTATADCVGPVITNVHAQNVTGNRADVLWTTNEGASSTVTYDTVTPPTAGTATKSALDTSHNVRVSGLQACTQYFYSVSSTDAAANSATDTNGGAYYTFTTGVNVNPTYQYTGPAVPIPDNNPTGATAIINVTDNKPVQKVTVRVNLTHTFDGDIALHLIGPDGTDVILSNKRGSSGDNFTNTVFDDDATTPIASGTAPFTGTFKPDAALSAFNGKNALGQWKFFVVDNASVDTGNILDWDLVLTYPPQACGPAVEYQSSSKSDSCIGTGTGGGNGVIEPGETVVLPVTAHNSGTAAVTGISGTLTTSTPGVTITDNFATFPDLAVDAVGVSLPDHFSFFVDPSFPCGNTIDFAIHFTGNEGSWTSTFTLSTGTPGTTSATLTSTDVPKTITDNATVQSNLVVASTGTVLDVNVTLSITHTWDGDLNLRLIGPNGTVVPLSSRRGSSGDNFTGTTFDDSATTPISSGTAPFSGSYRPETPLAALNGIAANGTWKLEVNDAAAGDTGTLTAWSIQLTTSGNPSCLSCTPVQVAGEATNLHFLPGSKTDMEWSAALYATSYNLYRGVAADLPLLLNASDDSCRRLVVAGTSTGSVITEAPSSGAIYWYLVRGQNGTGEGPAGNATAGPRVQNSYGACP